MALRTLLHSATLGALVLLYVATAWLALHPQVSRLYQDHFIRHATVDWRIRRTDASIADGIDFAQGVYPRDVDYVLGLGGTEEAGRWSDARRWPLVSVLLREPVSGDQCLELRFGAAPPQVGKPVMVHVGDASATLIPRDEAMHEYRVSLTVTKPASSIDLEPTRPSRPLEWTWSGDVRRLGIMLRWLRLRSGSCPPD
jgi:hypothetical protein